MTPERSHQPSGPLALAVALAVIAGFVDAHIYVHVTPVFVANMSGNLVHLGIFVGAGGWREAAASLVAVAAFLGGTMAATVHHDHELQRTGVLRPNDLLLVEAALIALLPVLITVLSIHFTDQAVIGDYPVLIVGGLAMGIQATALRRVGEIAVATTYGTGAIVRIGEKLTLGLRGADRTGSHRRRVTISVLVVVLVSYVGGAILASAVGSSPAFLLAPAVALVGATVLARRVAPVRPAAAAQGGGAGIGDPPYHR